MRGEPDRRGEPLVVRPVDRHGVLARATETDERRVDAGTVEPTAQLRGLPVAELTDHGDGDGRRPDPSVRERRDAFDAETGGIERLGGVGAGRTGGSDEDAHGGGWSAGSENVSPGRRLMLIPSHPIRRGMNTFLPAFIGIPGGPELLVILLLAVLLFGADKLPGLARSTGEAIGEFKKGREQLEDEIRTAADRSEPEVDDEAVESA